MVGAFCRNRPAQGNERIEKGVLAILMANWWSNELLDPIFFRDSLFLVGFLVCSFGFTAAWCVYASLVRVDTGTRLACARQVALLEVCNRPWSLRGSSWMAMANGRWCAVCAFAAVHQTGPFSPCTVTVHGAAGHNRCVVVETPLLVKEHGPQFKCVARCLLMVPHVFVFSGCGYHVPALAWRARGVPSRPRHVRAAARRWKPNARREDRATPVDVGRAGVRQLRVGGRWYFFNFDPCGDESTLHVWVCSCAGRRVYSLVHCCHVRNVSSPCLVLIRT